MTPDDLEEVRRVVAEELDAALARRLAAKAKPRAGLLTLDEVAAIVHVSPETVRHWIWEGRLTAYKPGRAPLVKEAELLAFVEANETTKKRAARARNRTLPLLGEGSGPQVRGSRGIKRGLKRRFEQPAGRRRR